VVLVAVGRMAYQIAVWEKLYIWRLWHW
jgi:hypothetical protein